MRPYEVMVILDASLDDDVVNETIDRATKLVADRGGAVSKVDRWGKRRFAYEIQHRTEGYYTVIQTSAEPAVMADLERMLGLADEVVRHKVIRLPDKVAERLQGPVAGGGNGSLQTSTSANGA
jgi:small subunit ribosomal protein S6